MKYYVQFLLVDQHGFIADAIGSDGRFILDGRNNLDTMITDALTRYNQIKVVKPFYVGFQIQKGDFRKSYCIYQWLKENHGGLINTNSEWLSK